jgi:GT2 family glycosyltransferase
MKKDGVLLSVGVLVYREERYLPKFFESLEGSILKLGSKVELLVRDNGDQDNGEWVKRWAQGSKLKAQGVRIDVEKGENVGFAVGHNSLFRKSKGRYYACLNPDMVLEEDYLKILVDRLEEREKLGSVQGRILSMNGERIDSYGLAWKSWGVACNVGEGLENDQFSIFNFQKGIMKVWGLTGAAAVYRRSAFEEVGGFDERMFMYQEDVDLSYKLNRAGWECECVWDAVVYHDRTVQIQSRKKRSLRERKWSYYHHLLFLGNHWKHFSLKEKFLSFLYECLKWVYLLLFEREVWGEFWRWIRE